MPFTTIQVYQDSEKNIPLLQWLKGLRVSEPKAFEECLDRILRLQRHGNELRRPIADGLRDGIRELRAKKGRVQYRMLYSFIGKNVALITHGFTKEGKVPDREIDLAIDRVATVKSAAKTSGFKYVAEWEIDQPAGGKHDKAEAQDN